MSSPLIRAIDKFFYPGHEDNWDDQLLRQAILSELKPGFHILDLGAGAGIVPQMNYRGLVARVVGVDPDPRVKDNPYLDEAHVGLGNAMPYFPANTFDLVFSDNVLEHVEKPDTFLEEIHRILKPGGLLITKTPNRRHYMPLIARITPHWFHRLYNRLRGRHSADTFPTLYRLNTRNDQHRYAEGAGLRVKSILGIEGRPEYLRLSFLIYPLGIAYERTVNALGLEDWRILFISIFEKPRS